MCNSLNHSFDCRCGFGGEGHLGKNYNNSGMLENNYLHRNISYESFVNPNARCPVCGEPVFFYQSPYGGRVFFDELGHPWFKHPCTDTSLQNLSKDFNVQLFFDKNFVNLNTEQSWENDGWEPLICYKLEIDREIDRIRFVGYLSKFSDRLHSNFSTWRNKYKYELYASSEIPLITLSIKDVDKWIQNSSCVFTIYPTLIRENSSSENLCEISSFKIDENSNLVNLYTDEAYIPKASINDVISKERPLQEKRVYDGSSKEIEVLRAWKVDIKNLMRLKIHNELLIRRSRNFTRKKFNDLWEISVELSNKFNDPEDTLNWRKIVAELEYDF